MADFDELNRSLLEVASVEGRPLSDEEVSAASQAAWGDVVDSDAESATGEGVAPRSDVGFGYKPSGHAAPTAIDGSGGPDPWSTVPAPGSKLSGSGSEVPGGGQTNVRINPNPEPADQTPRLEDTGAEMSALLARWNLGLLQLPGLPATFSIDPEQLPRRAVMRRKVAAFLRLQAALQLLVDDPRPLMATASWLVMNVDGLLDERHARRQLSELQRAGQIRAAGTTPRGARLWEPTGMTMADALELIYRDDVVLRPAFLSPGPEIPALGREIVSQPGPEVEQEPVVDQAQPVLREDLGVVARGDDAAASSDDTVTDTGRKVHASELSSR